MLFTTTIIIFSCAKDGADGQPGASGANGLNGTNGTNGKDGNANVYGRVFTVQPIETLVDGDGWTKKTYTNSTNFYYSKRLLVPEITKAVLDRGDVHVYKSLDPSIDFWLGMPYTDHYTAGTTTYITTYTPAHSLGYVTIWIDDNFLKPSLPTKVTSFKVVVITPSGKIAHPNVNYNNYAEVAAAFDLE
jgi:hypothetical protein